MDVRERNGKIRRLADLGFAEDVTFRGCDAQTEIAGITCDWRQVEPQMAYVSVDPYPDLPRIVREAGACVLLMDARSTWDGGPAVLVPDLAERYGAACAQLFDTPAAELRLAAITGTNGKTTTAHLAGATLAAAGRRYGRFGTLRNWLVDQEHDTALTTQYPPQLHALLRRVRKRGGTDVVLEASSHALASGRLAALTFDAIGLTSFSPDHLEYHDTMASYRDAKLRLASEHLRPGSVAIAAIDDNPIAETFLQRARAHTDRSWAASRGAHPNADIAITKHRGEPMRQIFGLRTPLGTTEIITRLQGPHNADNILIACGLGLGLGISLEAIAEGVAQCEALPHRLERVATIDGIAFVDDSKATNTGAVISALSCFDNIYLIAGGRSKEPDLQPLLAAMSQVRRAYLIGEHRARLAEALRVVTECKLFDTLAEATRAAHQDASAEGLSNATILLSPACSSQDQFQDFAARGSTFHTTVWQLAGSLIEPER